MANGDSKLTIYKVTDPDGAGVDVQRAVVVVADSETRARQIAADNAGDEGVYVWAFKALVMVVGTAAKDVTEGLVLQDKREG